MRAFSWMIVLLSAAWLAISGARNEAPSAILAQLAGQLAETVAEEQVTGTMAPPQPACEGAEDGAETIDGGSRHAEGSVDQSVDPGRTEPRLATADASRIDATCGH
ncbi:hypothetical protein F3N42_09060 [Marinihelvus fidelis]|uniref:Secreted protein n=1 Tax=Marinihelvus fidelis TaxID=2613842 RepID=A0A5N0TBJ9_9GAMM|nr:hypothetical protein [Marinihelvus fidelis]KAA9131457.1 hypothetical protein F3N42_09060 [Marinihelvus fidelis]